MKSDWFIKNKKVEFQVEDPRIDLFGKQHFSVHLFLVTFLLLKETG